MKIKILIHESSVEYDEIMKFLKGMKNSEFTFVTSHRIGSQGIAELYKKRGSQIDDIHARVRMNNVIPSQFQDIAIFGSNAILEAHKMSKKFPDTRIFVVPVGGDGVNDIEKTENMKPCSWQFIHEYIANKTDSKPKKKDGKQERKNTSNISRAVSPATEKRDEWQSEYSDTGYSEDQEAG